MTYVHRVRRCFLSGRDHNAKKTWIWIPVYYSDTEQRYHRVLPDCLVKYKHYRIRTITDAVNQDEDLDQYSFPSDSSIHRWKKLAYDLLRQRTEVKHSDSSVSLPIPLRDHSSNSCTRIVNAGTVIHEFSTTELGRLLNHQIP